MPVSFCCVWRTLSHLKLSDSPSDSESALADTEGGLGGRGFGVGGDILFLPINSTYVPGKSPFSCPSTDAQIKEDWEMRLVFVYSRTEYHWKRYWQLVFNWNHDAISTCVVSLKPGNQPISDGLSSAPLLQPSASSAPRLTSSTSPTWRSMSSSLSFL